MNLVRTWVEAPPSIRWHLSRLRMPLLRRAFANIGANTVIVRPRTLRGVAQISLGADCSIFEGAWLKCESNPEATIHIGDRTYLGHDVHVHSIDPVHIGSDCVLADYVLVTSTDHDRVERKVTHGTGAVMIGDRVFIGQGATVLGGVTIGDGATIAAHSVVTRDVAAGSVVGGIPARVIGAAQ